VQLRDARLLLSPSDLNGFLACPHLTTLELLVARGELAKPFRVNPHADLIRRKGEEHERAYLARLHADGRDVFDARDERREEPVARTADALRAGREVVYQAAFADDGWIGFADFVELDADGGYEVVDTKLARRARPEHVLQLCFYTEQVARITGRMPRGMHVVGGLGERESFDPNDFLAYYRRLRSRFLARVANGDATYPYPVEHCGVCSFLDTCLEQWRDDDHLVQVANIMRAQVERLAGVGLDTLAALAVAADEARPPRMRPPTFATLRSQASLQLHERETGEPRHELLPLQEGHGFRFLPSPDDADVYLDLEGDPFYEPARGLDYLFGIAYRQDGELVYRAIRAGDRAGEKAAFEELVRVLVERRASHPGMHVYHYNHYERTALRELMGFHGRCEEEIDDLLRGEVLVDLYRVVRQALRISKPSYSLKQVEKMYGYERSADVRSGGESAVLFEEWLERRDDALLEEIERYNADDCLSTAALHEWLVALRPPEASWRPAPERWEASAEAEGRRAEEAALAARLHERGHELLANLVEYHRREAKPQWWEYFHHLTLDAEELVEDGDTIGGLELVSGPDDVPHAYEYVFSFPPQEHKIGETGVDPATEKAYGVEVDDEVGLLTLRRAKNRVEEALPDALIPPSPISDVKQRDAVKRFAGGYLDGSGAYRALCDVLERGPPRARLDGTAVEAAASLDETYLFVQGPPGSGKTYVGARMAVALMRDGRRVGVTSRSHKAIHRFLEEVRLAAHEVGYRFKGRKKGDGEDAYEDEFVDSTSDNADMLDPELQLLAGTAWLFARDELDGYVDTLFVDEAGQVALADAVAVGTAALNLVFLGDPNQLPHVSQGTHPPGADASVLAHLLAHDETVRPDMGLFLAETWRLRPEVNAYISSMFYESRLHPAAPALRRSLARGNGLRFLGVAHDGNRVASPEEAERIAAEIERLVGSPYRDDIGERTLEPGDIVIVAPYNAHVRCLRSRIGDERIRIGTVDKFQGQEAAVAFYAMGSSSGEHVPRGLEFLFSRNRLNVAVSRAKCAAYLVAGPRLLDASCRTVEQMRLVNALCRFAEVAGEAQGTDVLA
jgi:predicted RecB family nuclease